MWKKIQNIKIIIWIIDCVTRRYLVKQKKKDYTKTSSVEKYKIQEFMP